MHICFITHEYPKEGFPHGGIGSFVKTIAVELVKKGVKVSVVGINYTREDEFIQENGVDIYRLSKSKLKGISWYLNFKKINSKIKNIHKDNPIGVIETSELGLAFLIKIKNIKHIIRLHGGHHFFAEAENRGINKWKGFQEKLSFKKADGFIAVSNFVKDHTEKYLSFGDKVVELINYPIDTELFSPQNILVKSHSIVFAGTVCEKKGIRQLIQSFPVIKNEFPDATLEIYGRDWFFKNGDSYIDFLKKEEMGKLGQIAEDIHFHGVVEYKKIPEKYAEAHICVFPSHMETQGLVAPEAMAMEKLVIFTTKGPGPETIAEYETGLLCDPLNPNDIAEKIIWAFENNEESKKIAKLAREFVVDKFSLNNIVHKNIVFFEKMIDSK